MPTPEQLLTLQTKIAPAAVACEKRTGLPAPLSAAQCILESGYLAHAPGNNCFGIKEYAGCHGKQLLHTREWFTDAELAHFLALCAGRTATLSPGLPGKMGNRHLYEVQDWFATFATLADCFVRRGLLYRAPGPYSHFATAYDLDHDLEALVRGIAPTYATDSHYADQVLALIHMPALQAALAAVRLAVTGYGT